MWILNPWCNGPSEANSGWKRVLGQRHKQASPHSDFLPIKQLSKGVSHVFSMSSHSGLRRPDGPMSVGTDLPSRWVGGSLNGGCPVPAACQNGQGECPHYFSLFPTPTSFELTCLSSDV